ncbi:IS110 family transposase [Rhodopirellula bahusiensis]|uniref:IS110 family transposase n=1 Tax=Rhodopirellula bahusiensis TaxID=2014065 RepID=UPI003263A495
MATKAKSRSRKTGTKRFIGKPTGHVQERVQQCGPQHFGIIAVDCAKRRSKWMLCDFFGRVLIEPTMVEHRRGDFATMIALINDACQAEGITDRIAAVEMTGIYHKPVLAAFRKAGFDTRIVHPFASSHHRKPLHPDAKTDDNDLEAIFLAAVAGYGLASLPIGEAYQHLQALSRHRHNLIKQQARLKVQIRRLMHQAMPGYADLWEDDKLYHRSIAMPIALAFPSAASIQKAGAEGLARHLREQKTRFQARSLERIVTWSRTAAEPSELSALYTRQWQNLNSLRESFHAQVHAVEREMSGFLVKTPYVLLLSVTGINVVSAARLAGEAGPIEHYASSRAINGRAGLYPSRYQSDEVDNPDGKLVRQANRRLRSAAMLVAENLIKCHPYYRGLSNTWKQRKVDPRDRRCRIANRAMRMVFQLVGGRQLWRGKGVDREYLLSKLQAFHQNHQTPITQSVAELNEAFAWLPTSSYAAEAKPLAELARKKRRGPTALGDLLVPLLVRLGVSDLETVESISSEARSSR